LNDSLRQYNKKTNFDDGLIKISNNGYLQDLNEDFISISNLFKWCKENDYSINPQFLFFDRLLSNFRNYKWVDIEYEYYMALVEIYRGLEKSNVLRSDFHFSQVKPINDCFELIKKKLVEYLLTVKVTSRHENMQIESILLEGTGPERKPKGEKLFLYFNYTSTMELYTRKYFFNQNNLIYIHGELRSSTNPIIFGYGDEMDPHYGKIENLNNNEFLRNIKSFGYFRTNNYQRVNSFIEGDGKEFTVKILGHSCGLSDRILLNTIFEHPNCKWIKIYYYQKSQTENDYFEKTQEISRHFKASEKGNMRAKIVSFKESDPLVPLGGI
jgi:hypothetical protein